MAKQIAFVTTRNSRGLVLTGGWPEGCCWCKSKSSVVLLCAVLGRKNTLPLITPSSSSRNLRNETWSVVHSTRSTVIILKGTVLPCPLGGWGTQTRIDGFLTLLKDCVVVPKIHIIYLVSKITSEFLSCCHYSHALCVLPQAWCFLPLCFRAHRRGDPEVRHHCHQWSWQVTQLHSGRQGLQHLISKCQWEVLRIHPERRNQPWQGQQCRAEWHAEEGELGPLSHFDPDVVFDFPILSQLCEQKSFDTPGTSVTFLTVSLARKLLDCDEEKEPYLNLSLLALSDWCGPPMVQWVRTSHSAPLFNSHLFLIMSLTLVMV